jgi:hypothetical protein
MSYFRVISAALLGTSAMTAFSYAVSEKSNRQFREPELLARMIKRLLPHTGNAVAQTEGWILHYTVGLLFCIAYDRLWRKTKLKPSVVSGLVLGGACGLIGMSVWKKTFELHPNPPATDRKNFFAQLLPAHLVFGAFSAAGYKAPKEYKI